MSINLGLHFQFLSLFIRSHLTLTRPPLLAPPPTAAPATTSGSIAFSLVFSGPLSFHSLSLSIYSISTWIFWFGNHFAILPIQWTPLYSFGTISSPHLRYLISLICFARCGLFSAINHFPPIFFFLQGLMLLILRIACYSMIVYRSWFARNCVVLSSMLNPINICVKFKTFGWFSLFILGLGFCLSIMFFVDGFIIMCSELFFENLLVACLEMLYVCVFGVESYAYAFIFPSLHFIWDFIYLFYIGSD